MDVDLIVTAVVVVSFAAAGTAVVALVEAIAVEALGVADIVDLVVL